MKTPHVKTVQASRRLRGINQVMNRNDFGIILCSRSASSRLPNKVWKKVRGKYIIAHLLERLRETGIKTILAVPEDEVSLYSERLKLIIDQKAIHIYGGHKTDCLKRTLDAALQFGINKIIRVTHDKIFVDHRQVNYFIEKMLELNLDYIYSTNFIEGMSFEIFKTEILEQSSWQFKDIEHLSFAVDSVSKKKLNLEYFPYSKTWLNRKKPGTYLRLLIDYPEDYRMMEQIMIRSGIECDIEMIVNNLGKTPLINRLPELTVYTCSYNDTEFLDEAIKSVLGQDFDDFEYLLIDDGSNNNEVFQKMDSYTYDTRVRVLRNPINLGLASSSNIALKESRGKYILRLDADDFLISTVTLKRMIERIKNFRCDALYPDNIRGQEIQKGYEHHHVGGTMFRKRSLDFIKFTDGLRNFEGLDLYMRAEKLGLKIQYSHEVGFFYRIREGSMSTKKCQQRKEVEKKLKQGIVGKELING